MKTYTNEQLEEIIRLHKLWLNDEVGGVRADLRGCDLSYSNLRNSDLRGCALSYSNLRNSDLRGCDLSYSNLRNSDLRGCALSYSNLRNSDLRGCDLSSCEMRGTAGNRSEIKSIFASEIYPITYTAEYLQIGCERHKISDWWAFDDDLIYKMDGSQAVDFWEEWKDMIKLIIEKSPAKKTGKEADE